MYARHRYTHWNAMCLEPGTGTLKSCASRSQAGGEHGKLLGTGSVQSGQELGISMQKFEPRVASCQTYFFFQFFKKYIFIYLTAPGLSCTTQDLQSELQYTGSSSLTRDRAQAPCIRNAESQPLNYQGSPSMFFRRSYYVKELVFTPDFSNARVAQLVKNNP